MIGVSRTSSPHPTVRVPPCEHPRVSCVVVTFGTGPVVLDALRSLVDGSAPVPIEIIVVDQPHPRRTDATFVDLAVFTAGVRVVRPEANVGFGGGCELGAMHARGDHLAFVNPDVTVPDGWLEPLLEVLDGDRGVSIVAPVLVEPDGSIQEAGQLVHPDGATSPELEIRSEAPFDVAYASGACWVMRRDEHERLGGFDPSYSPAYFEDVDLVFRARSLGGRAMVHPGVRVTHLGGRGTPDRPSPAHRQREIFRRRWLA